MAKTAYRVDARLRGDGTFEATSPDISGVFEGASLDELRAELYRVAPMLHLDNLDAVSADGEDPPYPKFTLMLQCARADCSAFSVGEISFRHTTFADQDRARWWQGDLQRQIFATNAASRLAVSVDSDGPGVRWDVVGKKAEEHGIDPARARLIANAARVDLDWDMAMRALEREGLDPEAAETALERICADVSAIRILYDEQARAPRRRRDLFMRLEGAFAVAVLTTLVAALLYFTGALSGFGVN